MKKGWFILLTLSLGLNAGLIFMHFARPMGYRFAPPPFLRGDRFFGRGAAPFEGGHPPWHKGGHPILDRVMEHRMGRMADGLGLETPQREELTALLQEMVPLILGAKDDVAVAREAIRDEYLKGEVDPDSVRAALAALNAEQARLDSLVAETMLRESLVLTPEQRDRYMNSMPWERHLAPGGGGGPHHRERDGRSAGRGDGKGRGGERR